MGTAHEQKKAGKKGRGELGEKKKKTKKLLHGRKRGGLSADFKCVGSRVKNGDRRKKPGWNGVKES